MYLISQIKDGPIEIIIPIKTRIDINNKIGIKMSTNHQEIAPKANKNV